MPFPTTPVLESGTGADVSPLTTFTDGPDGGVYGGLRRTSNQLASITTDSWDYYNVAQYGASSEVYCTFPVLTAAAVMAELGCKTKDTGTAGIDQYALSVRKTEFRIFRYDNGTPTQLGAGFSLTFSAGDSAGFVCSPGVQAAYYKSGAGAWTLVGSRADTTYDATGGHLTLYIADTTGRVTNFGGGTVTDDDGSAAWTAISRRRRRIA